MTDYAVPPPELVQQWVAEFYGTPIVPGEACTDLAIRAAQWGADTELEACEQAIIDRKWFASPEFRLAELHNARRPNPPSLKEQALEQLDGIATVFRMTHGGDIVCDKILAALEALPE
jgi:hypothetical protein